MPEQLPLYGGMFVVLVASLNALLSGVTTLWSFCFGGTGKIRFLIAPTLVATAINVAISFGATAGLQYWAGSRYAIVGPLLGTTSVLVLVNIWAIPLLLRKTFGVSLRSLARAVFTPLLLGVPYATVLWYIVQSHPPRGWLSLAVGLGASCVGFFVVAWALLLNTEERDVWKKRFVGAVSRTEKAK